MARLKKIPIPVTAVSADFGQLKTVDVRKSKEKWSEFTLADGTTLSIRPVIIEIKRSNKFNLQGDPIYVAMSHIVLKAKVPKRLKKKRK